MLLHGPKWQLKTVLESELRTSRGRTCLLGSPAGGPARGLRRGTLVSVERHGIGPAAAENDNGVQVGKYNNGAHRPESMVGERPPRDRGEECSGRSEERRVGKEGRTRRWRW